MWNVFTPLPSKSAKLLATQLGGVKLKRLRPLPIDDVIVNWGSVGYPFADERVVFNRVVVGNKLRELEMLAAGGLPVPAHARDSSPGWLPRTFHHREGTDFKAPIRGDYYVERVPTTREFRFHVFNFGGEDQRILRWGEKLGKEGAHPWIRSHKNGWRISYGKTELPKGLRSTAKLAIAKLGYSFGAVDLALTSDGKPVIFEVNSAPGLDAEGQTLLRYVAAFKEAVGDGQEKV